MPSIDTQENTPKCPMGKHPWLATIIALAFVAFVIAKKFGVI